MKACIFKQCILRWYVELIRFIPYQILYLKILNIVLCLCTYDINFVCIDEFRSFLFFKNKIYLFIFYTYSIFYTSITYYNYCYIIIMSAITNEF